MADGTAAAETVSRPALEDLDLPLGKRVRLHRILYEHGVGNGTLLALPIDQGIEHGPIDFLPNPPSADPNYQFRLAVEGGYNAIACHWGMARRYMKDYAGRVPLILKINGKTNIPSDAEAISSPTATVEDAVALGADAVGYTLYVGSPMQDEDFRRLMQVRDDCEKYGMPLVVWSYPRGRAIEEKGGRDSIYAVDYAARLAHEFGADVIKLNVPKKSDKDSLMPQKYQELEWDYAGGARRVISTANNSMVLFSGGSKVSDEDLMNKARTVMEEGATGLIFGRNMWQRPYDEALEMTAKIKELLSRFPV
ncbi:MAG: class I fructose-bisphosphate aldolase [Candidatus Longimicrobiales bacterium M2_2A_002]